MYETNISNKIALMDNWQIIKAEPQKGVVKELEKPEINSFNNSLILDARLPQDVNKLLVENNEMPDPLFDTNGRDCYWVTSKEWWFYKEFNLDSDLAGTELCLTGVDGTADIWLNDSYLGEMKNSFREFRFNVSEHLQEGNNQIYIRFRSIDDLLDGPRLGELSGWKGRRAYLRKPQFSFGWDWALPLPSIGLLGDVWLETGIEYRFVNTKLESHLSGRVDLDFEVSPAAKKRGYDLILLVDGPGMDEKECKISCARYKLYVSINIDNPQLWFPNGYGEQPLYSYKLQLYIAGEVVDEKTGRFAFREVKIVEKPFTEEAGPGFSFQIYVNNTPIFCKGANWIPTDLWPVISPQEEIRNKYYFYIKKAKEANFNMLRVWGGGIYESDLFYDLCDEMGIMIWQDFMFASTGYPVELLRDEIIAEARYQIKRLREHPSICLWCGTNEDVYSWVHPDNQEAAWQDDDGVYSLTDEKWKVDRYKYDPQLYTMILRGLVDKMGIDVPYIESSPQSRDDSGNMPNSGNSHISCWKYMLFSRREDDSDFRKHFEQVCSFNSEFCIQGPCSQYSIEEFMAEENHWPPNEGWIYHIQRGHKQIPHYEQTMGIAEALLGEVNSLTDYVKYGQTVHLEMMRAEFESARRDRPNNGGTMVWMFNDCWPTSNWSLIDYYRRPKPSYYAAKRACQPLLPIIFERNGVIEYFFSNESAEDKQLSITVGQKSLSGKTEWKKTINASISANSLIKYHSVKRDELSLELGDYLFMEVEVDGNRLSEVSYFPDGWKDIEWPEPDIGIEILELNKETSKDGDNNAKCGKEDLNKNRNGESDIKSSSYMSSSSEYKYLTEVTIKTDKFARLCHLISNDSNNKIWFSDNYFDLPADNKKTVFIESSRPLNTEELEVSYWGGRWE